MLIEVSHLDAGYGRKKVLSAVSFEFDGGAVGLLGPNGAGKSTLLKTLLGFLPPLSGSISVFGKAMPGAAREVRGQIGYMPETESFVAGMNGVSFVALMAQLSGLPRPAAMERAHEVLQYVGLGEARYRNIETYSTGMKQRVKLAQAIVHDPAAVLLDEPTNGMDAAGRTEMIDLVNDLARNKGLGVILCSHIMGDVEQVASEIIVLGNGRVASKRRTMPHADADRVLAVRVRGDREAFRRAIADSGISAAVNEDMGDVMVRLASEQKASILYRAAAETQCVILRMEPRKEKMQDLLEQALEELGHAHL